MIAGEGRPCDHHGVREGRLLASSATLTYEISPMTVKL